MATMNALEAIARDYDADAKQHEADAASGFAKVPSAALARANTCRRAARSIRLEIETGVAHCACCLKPMSAHKNT